MTDIDTHVQDAPPPAAGVDYRKLWVWIALGSIVAAAAGVYWLTAVRGRVTIDGAALQDRLSSWLTEHGDPAGLSVTCPTSPKGKAGYVFVCTVDGSPDVSGLRVVIDNDHGDVEWTAIPK